MGYYRLHFFRGAVCRVYPRVYLSYREALVALQEFTRLRGAERFTIVIVGA